MLKSAVNFPGVIKLWSRTHQPLHLQTKLISFCSLFMPKLWLPVRRSQDQTLHPFLFLAVVESSRAFVGF